MDCKEIFDILSTKHLTDQAYEVFEVDNECYFGKDRNDNVVFMIPSKLTRVAPVFQETHSLRFAFNKKCSFRNGEAVETKVVHLLTCKDRDDDHIIAFIRLTRAFAQNDRDNDQYFLAKLFSSISALFDKERTVSEIELQGLYTELYSILYLKNLSCDVARFWQSRNKMKFDFTINEKKRLEIKSTVKSSRTHHFKHDQLLSELYDIKILSYMLRKSDYGLSLGELVDTIRDCFADNFALLMHIESVVSHVDKDQLHELKYDEIYLKDNIKCFDAKEVPHFNEKTPDGVFNAEYDCCLDTSISMQFSELVSWISEG